jgi:2-dehydropantoate 2-reductase
LWSAVREHDSHGGSLHGRGALPATLREHKMKIMVLGAGALGGYYGARLIEAGAEVTFMVRPGRRYVLKRNGLRVESALGSFGQQVSLVSEGDDLAQVDLVLLTCKSYDLDEAVRAITPVVDAGASILPLLNGMAPYDQLDAQFGPDKVLGGVAYVASTLHDDGVIRQAGPMDKLMVGARAPRSEALAASFHALVAKTPGVRLLSDFVEQALWNKWVVLSAGAAVCCLMRGTLRQVLSTRCGEALMRRQIVECVSIATASGYPPSEETLEETHAFLLNKDSDWAPSMMRDINQGHGRLEADVIVGDMLTRAMALGLPAILTAAAYTHLQVYGARAASGG